MRRLPMRRLLRTAHPSLLALLGAVALFGVAWALVVPPGQAPDEPAHFAYAQSLAEDLERPPPDDGDRRDIFSTEQLLAGQHYSNAGLLEGRTYSKPEWSGAVERRFEERAARLGAAQRGDGGGANPAGGNPPLYYAYEALPYRAASGGDLFDRLYLMRLWSALLLLVAVAATWLLVGELTGRDRLLQLAGAACVGLAPMATFISASVNPDAALMALVALALWLGVRLLRDGASLPIAAGLIGVTALALLVKQAGFAVVPAAVLALTVALRRAARERGRALSGRSLAAVVLGGGAAVALAGAAAASRLDDPLPEGVAGVRQFASYLWQFYLPRLPFQEPVEGLGDNALYEAWVKTAWAAFGWLEVRFPEWVYVLLAAVTILVVAGAAAALLRRRFHLDRAVAAFLALFALALVLGLHWTEYRFLVDERHAFMQGRYLLPLLPIVGLAVAAGLTNLAPARRAPAVAVVLSGLFALQLFSLAIVVGRFYA